MFKLDFVVIGAMKAATTTLADYLAGSSQVVFSSRKEPQFFSRPEKSSQGWEWYESLFADRVEGQLRGEGSTCYSRWPTYPGVPEKLYAHNPALKLVYVVRNPADRAYSHYRHSMLKQEFHYDSFRDALEQDEEVLSTSLYMLQLNRYRQYFPDEQILVIDYAVLVSSPAAVLARIADFLGIE